MFKNKQMHIIFIAATVIVVGTFLLYNSFESRFNTAPAELTLTSFKNTKHFNISIFGEDLSEQDSVWLAFLAESFYGKMQQWYGDQSNKDWITIYVAKSFPDYYRPNGEMILLPTRRVVEKDAQFVLIKIAHLMTGSYKWPWYKNHIAAEGLAAYFADLYLGKRFYFQKGSLEKADLAKLDNASHFVWKKSPEEQASFYSKAGGLMEYIIKKFGIERVKQLYDRKGEGWEEIFGLSLEQLENQWLGNYQ